MHRPRRSTPASSPSCRLESKARVSPRHTKRTAAGCLASFGQRTLLAFLVLVAWPLPGLCVEYDLWSLEPSILGTEPEVVGMWGTAIHHQDGTQVSDPLSEDHISSEYYPVHASLLRHGEFGKLVFFRNQLFLIYDLDPQGIGKEEYDSSSDSDDQWMFCSGHTLLPNGDLLIVGGDWGVASDDECLSFPVGCVSGDVPLEPAPPFVSFFDTSPSTGHPLGRVFPVTDMPNYNVLDSPHGGSYDADSSRYYPTAVTLPSGNTLVVGGSRWVDNNPSDCCLNEAGKPNDRTWLELDASTVGNGTGTWTILTTSYASHPMDWQWASPHPDSTDSGRELAMPFDYSKMFVLPRGLLWLGWPNGSIPANHTSLRSSRLWEWPDTWPVGQSDLFPTTDVPKQSGSHSYGSPILLTLSPPYFSSSPQAVLLVGGGNPNSGTATKLAEIVDYSVVNPSWAYTTEPMDHDRARPDAVLLPDGEVLVVGGADFNENPDPQNPTPWRPIYECEMFDPSTGLFRPVDSISAPRMYHSEAILLPDGRVLATGNEPSRTDPGWGAMEGGQTYEIYWPPYLFSSSTEYADRPVIDTVEDEIFFGLPFLIEFSHETTTNPPAIEEVMLMPPGSVTHGVNFNQRRVILEASIDPSSGEIWATAPWQPTVAPPGDYMVMLLDEEGVPSVGKFVNLKRAASTATTGSPEVWRGTVRLDRDFTVESGDTLIIMPGTTVLVSAFAGFGGCRSVLTIRAHRRGGSARRRDLCGPCRLHELRWAAACQASGTGSVS